MIRKLLSTVLVGWLGASSASADLASLPLKVEGKLVGAATDEGAKGKEVQNKQLEIRLTSLSSKDFGPLRVKCTFFARDLKTGGTVVENVVVLNTAIANGEVTVKTPLEAFKSTQEHFKGDGVTARGKPKKNVKKIEASGHEYSGWGIQVLDKTDRLLGKDYSAPYLDPDTSKP